MLSGAASPRAGPSLRNTAVQNGRLLCILLFRLPPGDEQVLLAALIALLYLPHCSTWRSFLVIRDGNSHPRSPVCDYYTQDSMGPWICLGRSQMPPGSRGGESYSPHFGFLLHLFLNFICFYFLYECIARMVVNAPCCANPHRGQKRVSCPLEV